eukprot:Seg2088.1 transcript_id=Seg2088.1/GoldUCD/mRNA.D3Y31 product="Hsp70-binding protein 1" protein_id=Seg2088.1/GoldUCD/D3Y31
MECKSLDELLKISLKLTDEEMREWPTHQKEFEPERQKWLKEAIESILQNEDLKILKECLQILHRGGYDEIEEEIIKKKSKALDDIIFLLDSDHNATDLHLIGGLPIISGYLGSPVSSLRWRAAEILANTTQNKPVCQLAVMDIGAIGKLVALLKNDDVDMVKVKAIFALSCITKNCAAAIKSFVDSDGMNALIDALNSDFEKIKLKASFMLISLTFDDESIIHKMVSADIVPLLISMLKGKHNAVHGHITRLLLEIVSKSKHAVLQCKMPDYLLKRLLTGRKEELQVEDPEQFEDEIEHCSKILTICFQS